MICAVSRDARIGASKAGNEHLDYDDGAAVFQHACKIGLQGIVLVKV
jgi:hypothetical protein